MHCLRNNEVQGGGGQQDLGIWHARGLHQGDPLSFLLFVLVIDILTAIIMRGEQEMLFGSLDRWGIRHRLSVNADDVVLLIRPLVSEAEAVVGLLKAFGADSGLHCNLAKSFASLIRFDEANLQAILHTLACPVKCFPVRNLELPLSAKQLTKNDLQPYVDRAAGHLPTWKASLLRSTGRLVLINSTLTAIYPMLVLDLPPWFLACNDKLCRGFFWCGHAQAKGGSCLVNWKLVCTLEEYGGLGVKNLHYLNNALMLKWRWLEKVGQDKPWESPD